MRKLLFTIFSISIISITFFSVKYIKDRNPKSTLGSKNEQKVFKEEISPSVLLEEKEEVKKSTGNTKIFVPSYWKNGYIQKDFSDYLKGYIPNISWFKKYFTTYQEVKFGVAPNNSYDVKEIVPFVHKENIFKSKGMLNESSFFGWKDDECSTSYSDILGKDIYYCSNWLNWLGVQKDRKNFVFTDCTVFGRNGYCVFEDYVRVYYDLNMSSEVRCFGSTSGDYLCDFDSYLSLIKI